MATTRKLGWFGALVIGAIFIGAGYFIVHLTLGAYHMGQASETWPTTQGEIIHSKVVSSAAAKGKTTYSADIQFSYWLDGQKYKSSKIEAVPGTSSGSGTDSTDAYEMVTQYPVGQIVSVHYNPSKPYQSVLKPGIANSIWWMFGAGGLFMLMGAWIALSGIARVLLGVGMLGVLTLAWLKRDHK